MPTQLMYIKRNKDTQVGSHLWGITVLRSQMPEVPASFLQSKICEVLDAWGSSSINSMETSIAFYRDSTGFVETHQTLGHQITLTKQQCFEEPETDGLNFPWNTIGFKNDWVKEDCQIHNFWKRIWDIFFFQPTIFAGLTGHCAPTEADVELHLPWKVAPLSQIVRFYEQVFNAWWDHRHHIPKGILSSPDVGLRVSTVKYEQYEQYFQGLA